MIAPETRQLIRSFLVFAMATVLLPANAMASSKQQMREYGQQLEKTLADARRTSEEEGSSLDQCRIGINYAHDSKTVMSVGREAYALGFREKDVMLRYGGVPIDPDDPNMLDRLPKYSKGEEITVAVWRDGREVEVKGRCPHTYREDSDAWAEVVKTLTRDRPDQCLEKLNQIENSYGRAWPSLAARNVCYYRKLDKSRWRQGTLADYAAFVLSQYMFVIESASYRDGALEDLRPEIMRILAWLDNNRQNRFSRELENFYRDALAEQSSPPERDTPMAGATSTGTCFAVSDDGLVLTSEHVISRAKQITVRFEDGETYSAIVESASASTDLALLRTSRKANEYLGLAPMRSSQPGDEVFTYGYPASSVLGSEPKFTDGTVSALSGPGGEAAFLQISVPVQPGNSGGPLVNNAGQIVGIVAATAAIEPFIRSTGSLPQNVNWAVKADYARLMFDTSDRPDTENRESAIARARNSICYVEATH